MSTETTLLPGEPIILHKLDATFSLAKDMIPDSERVTKLLDSSQQPLYLIVDLTDVKLNFSDLVASMATATKGGKAVLRHPNIKQIIAVTTSDLLALGAKALKQAQYGQLEAQVFSSLDEALTYVRQAIATG
jgi:hypothetical protein